MLYSYFCGSLESLDFERSEKNARSSTCVGFNETFRTKRLRTILASFIPAHVVGTQKKKRIEKRDREREECAEKNTRAKKGLPSAPNVHSTMF